MTATLLDEAPLEARWRQRPQFTPRRDVDLRLALSAAVRRTRLLTELGGPGGPPFAVLVAPAGYGKTTVLLDWCAQDPRPTAWLSVEPRHDDPIVLLREIVRVADRAYSRADDERIVLVVDDVHNLRNAGAQETLAGIVRQPLEGMTIVLSSRAELPLPMARLSAQGLVTELRAPALAMTRAEAAELYRLAGFRVEADSLDALMRATEGWPAGLGLAAISLRGHAIEPFCAHFDGRDRLAADYVRDEILTPLDDEAREFVTATAALDVLLAPLCDAVLDRTGSAAVLARLQRAGFPLVAVDRNGERLRHHRLVRDVLLAELRRTAPDFEAVVHRRASAWHERAGNVEAALRHALAAGRGDRAAAIVCAAAPGCVERASGKMLEHWLSLFAQDQIAEQPRLAVVAAWAELAQGQGDLAEHWLRTAARGAARPEIAGGIAALRAGLGREGLVAMGDDALRASGLLGPDDPARAFCRLVAGVAAHLRGRREEAQAALEDGTRRAAVHAPHVHALCLAQLTLLALDDGEREEAAGLIARSRAQIERFGLERYPSSALALAVSALVRAQRGRVDDAARDLAAATALVERLTDFPAWYIAEVEIVLARAALRLSDVNAARRHARRSARSAGRLPDAATLVEWLAATEEDIRGSCEAARALVFPLTAAELKVLQYLPTHLTFRQIAELSCVTANTVKTQANAAYRKLGVRSRSDAVLRARELGLVDS
jgi:LuxR family maltose regulon positive regulatory protein